MKAWLVTFALALCATGNVHAQTSAPDPVVVERVQDRLITARYMSPPGGCESYAFPGWPAGSVERCVYRVCDAFFAASAPVSGDLNCATAPQAPAGSVQTRRFDAVLYLANADADRLARWVTSACAHVATPATRTCMFSAINWIKGQSGSQFAVAGQVFEDIHCEPESTGPHATYLGRVAHAGTDDESCTDGINEPYMFRDGVTVKITGCQHYHPIMTPGTLDPYANCRTDGALNRDDPFGSVPTGRARIASTLPAEFITYTGRTDLSPRTTRPENAAHWLETVRETYQRALQSDENPLLSAHVCWANRSREGRMPEGCTPDRNGYEAWRGG